MMAQIQGTGTYSLEVVGESHYQKELESICGGRSEESAECIVDAFLYFEDDNAYDNKAVRVEVNDKTVGYLKRDEARQYRNLIAEAGHAERRVMVSAKIVGGWDRGGEDRGHFGIRLDIPIQN